MAHRLREEGPAAVGIEGLAMQTIKRRLVLDAVPFAVFGVFFVAGIVWLVHPWQPVEDMALTELVVRRVGTDLPLSGAYSSLPFRHPGPALFLWLWWPYELFGERSSAMLAANLWFEGIVLAIALGTARRLGGRTLVALLAVGVAIWSTANGLPLLLQPWNPYVGALPTIALILLTWAMVERRARALPIAVVLGSWMVQAHIQFGPIVGVLVGAGTVALVARWVRTAGWADGLRRVRWPALWALGLGLLVWSPVIVDVVANGGDSNPAAIREHYASDEQPETIDRRDVSGIVRSQLSLQPTWAGGDRPYRAYLSPVADPTPWFLAVAAAAVALAASRRAWRELRGMAVGGLALLAAFAALTRVSGPIGSWYLVAVEGASITFFAIVTTSLLQSLRVLGIGLLERLRPGSEPPAWAGTAAAGARVALGAVAVAAAVFTVSTLDLREDEQTSAAVARRMRPAVDEAVGDAPVYLEARSGKGGWVQSVLVLQFDREGREVHASTTLEGKFPGDIAAPPPDDAVRLVVVTDPPPDVQWNEGVEVVGEERYLLGAEGTPIHVVIVSAPLDQEFVTRFQP
jgi:hypothetical protein